MSDVENGKRNVSLDILDKISAFFDLPLSDFMARVEGAVRYDDNNNSLKEWLINRGYKEAMLLESPSYRNAVIGISEEGRVIYSARIIIEDMVIDEGMDYEEAVERFNNNLLRSISCMGEKAPVIQHDIII